MALNKEQLIQLARANAKASLNPSVAYSFEGEKLTADALSTTFAQELNNLAKTARDFEENKNLIFRLVEESLTEVLPPMILSAYGQFADVKTVGLGDKPVFKIKITEASRKRAKQFITKVGAAGRYETFKLDGRELTVPTGIIGGAARVEWEELLRGSFSMNDYYSLVLEGIQEEIYKEIAKALTQTVTDIKTINKTSQTSFNETAMDKLLMIADTYGHAAIYCTFEFAATMLPADSARWSDAMKDQIWNNGAFASYKGHQVIILPQSFEDETNAKKVIDPSKAYIIPTGAEKPIKVVFEGSAQVKAFDNRDWSQEINTYQRVGVGTYMVNPGICVYENTSLTLDM